MNNSSPLLLISLSRRGLPKYAAAIANGLRLEGKPFFSICAIGGEHPIPGAFLVPTFKGIKTLLSSSIFVLPFVLLFIAGLRLFAGVRTVYFPYIHAWTPIILLWSRLLGCRSVVTYHDYHSHLGESSILARLVLFATPRIATNFIFLSDHVRNEALLDRPSIAQISAVITHGLYSLPSLVRKTPKSLRSSPKTFIFLGRISPYKGVELLIRAFEKAAIAGARLIIAGKSNYSIDVKDIPHGVELVDRYLDEDEMAALLNLADVLVLPYLEATQSGIAILGIASGTPMVCTCVGGLMEQLGENEALFCLPETAALSEALVRVSKLDCRRHLCNELQKVELDFDWRDTSNRIYNFCTN